MGGEYSRGVDTNAEPAPVRVHLFAAARAAVGCPAVDVFPGSIAQICEELETRFPAFAAVRPRCTFLMDEVVVHGDPRDILVPAGARLDVLPPFAGG